MKIEDEKKESEGLKVEDEKGGGREIGNMIITYIIFR